MYKVYTDGSCRRDGTGGYGFIVVNEKKEIIYRFVKKELNTTNQRMELRALIAACEYCEQNKINAKIFSDSAYCLNCYFDKWYVNWEKNGFRSSKGNAVKNSELWKKLIPHFKNNKYIELIKVKGHDTNFYNNFIDSLVTTISSSKTVDLTGQNYGLLTVKGLYGNKFTEGKNTTYWLCQCECGAFKVVSHTNLTNDQVKSCGKCLAERYKDLTKDTFGFLQPIEKIDKDNRGYAIWKCKCLNCNSIISVSSHLLQAGQISCGCIKSKGEEKIAKELSALGINFIREYKFSNCKDILPLKFDFAVFINNSLFCLIEYQGEQHYHIAQNLKSWNNEMHLNRLQEHDKLKREYCQQHGYPLIEIPYTDYDKIDTEYIRRVMNL